MLILVYTAFTLILVYLITQYFANSSRNRKLKTIPEIPTSFWTEVVEWLSQLFSNKPPVDAGLLLMENELTKNVKFEKEGVRLQWYGNQPVVSVFSPEFMELILTSNVSVEKSFDYTFLQRWLGTGLITSAGSKWKSRRKLLTPSFHFRILDDFLPSFNEQSRVLVQKLHSLVDEEYVDITQLVVLCTLDVVCETVMGVPIGAQKGENSEYVEAVHHLGSFYIERITNPWLWSDLIFGFTKAGKGFDKDIEILHNFTKKVIKEKKQLKMASRGAQTSEDKKDGDLQVKKRRALMDLLLDLHLDGGQLTEDDIREEVDTFMFAGHDTTAMGLTFALYCIGLYPDIQERVHEELDSLFSGDKERHVTMEDVRDMKYMECVLKESQRLYPSVAAIGRNLNEDITYKNMTIPKGTSAFLHFVSLHRNAEVFPDPYKFDPERFTQENVIKRHNYAFTPFSAGPRNCIGQKFALLEEKVVLSHILRNFTVVSLDPRDKVQLKMQLTLKTVKPIRLKFIPRK